MTAGSGGVRLPYGGCMATQSGGAIHMGDGAKASVTRCIFTCNLVIDVPKDAALPDQVRPGVGPPKTGPLAQGCQVVRVPGKGKGVGRR